MERSTKGWTKLVKGRGEGDLLLLLIFASKQFEVHGYQLGEAWIRKQF